MTSRVPWGAWAVVAAVLSVLSNDGRGAGFGLAFAGAVAVWPVALRSVRERVLRWAHRWRWPLVVAYAAVAAVTAQRRYDRPWLTALSAVAAVAGTVAATR